MKSQKAGMTVLLTAITACMLTLTVSANSSWHWISATRPYDLLPIVVVVTLALETLALTHLAQIQLRSKVLLAVSVGNALSFAAPYVWRGLTSELYTFSQLLERWPIYTVGLAYLLVTLIVELPVVYGLLRKHTDDCKRLLLVTLGANVVTTVITALVERVFCHGSW